MLKAEVMFLRSTTLFLMGKKGFHVLRLAARDYADLVNEVVVARDPNVLEDFYEDIVALCAEKGLRCVDRSKAGTVKTQYAVAISWRWLIDLSAERLIVFHDSLLPRYRGFNPLVSCLVNGETTIGVTALFGANDYDQGNIIAQAASNIRYPIKIADAIDTIVADYQTLARRVFEAISQGQSLTGQPQDESKASFSLWRDDEDYRVDWGKNANEIARFIDAVGYPYKGALSLVDGMPARIREVEPLPDVKIENRTPGKVIRMDNCFPIVVCGTGILKVLDLYDDLKGESMLPLTRFRTRFT